MLSGLVNGIGLHCPAGLSDDLEPLVRQEPCTEEALHFLPRTVGVAALVYAAGERDVSDDRTPLAPHLEQDVLDTEIGGPQRLQHCGGEDVVEIRSEDRVRGSV